MPPTSSTNGSRGMGSPEGWTNLREARMVALFSLSFAAPSTAYVFFRRTSSMSMDDFFLYFVFVLYLPRAVRFDFWLSRIVSSMFQRKRLPSFSTPWPENQGSL